MLEAVDLLRRRVGCFEVNCGEGYFARPLVQVGSGATGCHAVPRMGRCAEHLYFGSNDRRAVSRVAYVDVQV